MNRNRILDPADPNCAIRNVISRIMDKWSILVLRILEKTGGKAMRFGDLRRGIPDISQKMLTTTLRALEEDGLIRRKAYAEVPPRVEYSLTHRGTSLMPHLAALIDWAVENFDDIIADRNKLLK